MQPQEWISDAIEGIGFPRESARSADFDDCIIALGQDQALSGYLPIVLAELAACKIVGSPWINHKVCIGVAINFGRSRVNVIPE